MKKSKPAAQPADITLESIGPVDFLKLNLPQAGGITVLLGDNGAGKSEALAAVSDVLREIGRAHV